MALRDGLLAQFDHEMVGTRKTLERVPEGKPDWAPHPKSMKMGRLAGHLAELPGWAVETINRDSLDVRPAGGPQFQPLVTTSRKQLLEAFDKNAAAARAAISGASDETLLGNWTLLAGGQAIFPSAPGRSAQLRPQPHHSPPRPARRLPPHERRSRPLPLRPLRRRRPDVTRRP